MKTTHLLPALFCGALLAGAPVQARNYAVCVGINNYYYSAGLDGCVNDAKDFRAALLSDTTRWKSSDVRIITNYSATELAVRNTIRSFAKRAVKGDTFVYFHSGHGTQHRYSTRTALCMTDYYTWQRGAYSDAELAADLARFRSGVKVIVVVDACHSGGLMSPKSADAGRSQISSEALVASLSAEYRRQAAAQAGSAAAADAKGASVAFMTAARYYESSIDSYLWKGYDTDGDDLYQYNGRFTYALKLGFNSAGADRNGNSVISFGEDYTYAANFFWQTDWDLDHKPCAKNGTLLGATPAIRVRVDPPNRIDIAVESIAGHTSSGVPYTYDRTFPFTLFPNEAYASYADRPGFKNAHGYQIQVLNAAGTTVVYKTVPRSACKTYTWGLDIPASRIGYRFPVGGYRFRVRAYHNGSRAGGYGAWTGWKRFNVTQYN